MATNYWKIVNDVIRDADILIIVADARVPKSVNEELLKKIVFQKKKYMIVYNKEDLLDDKQKEEVNKILRANPFAMSTSAQKHQKTMRLLRKINALAKGENAVIGVIGYPNTGKSSIINAIKGRNSAPVSSQAGHTKGLQKLRATGKIVLLDTPGVIPFTNKDAAIQSLFSAKSPNQLKDPEGAAMKVIEFLEGKVENFYEVETISDFELTLDNISTKLNLKKKGNIPDTKRCAIRILNDWQKGKI